MTAGRTSAAGLCTIMAIVVWLGASPHVPAAAFDQGATGQMRREAVKRLGAGKLLVSARGLPDPNFADTVVLLADYDAQGAMGVIVNRQTDVPLGRLIPTLRGARVREMPAFFGGPVPADGVLALIRSNRARSDARHIVGDVYLVNTREVLDEVVARGASDADLRVFVGYAGWGARQLDDETAQGAWHVLDGSGAVVFDPDPDTVWERQILRTEGVLARHRGVPRAPAALLFDATAAQLREAP